MEDYFQKEYQKTQSELEMFYSISNIMHTTLNLEEILYIILTAVTAHVGLSFNRAMLFLVNGNQLEGQMCIGPDTEDDADSVWVHIEKHKMGFDELIDAHNQFKHLKKSQLHKIVKSIKIPIKDNPNIAALTASQGVPFLINTVEARHKTKGEFYETLDLSDFVTVPLKAKNKVIGVILADNRFTQKPITTNDIRILTMFANQAGLAIENSMLYEKTVILSNSDSLTGLWNHGYFQYLLQKEVKNASLLKESFTILMTDIDNFKRFNDTYGHQSGDAAIKAIADIFREASRKIDIIARYGGEEFVVLLPNTKKQEALILAERLRKAVEESLLAKNITISIGIASFPSDGEEKEILISKADKALYEAKKSGKNIVCL